MKKLLLISLIIFISCAPMMDVKIDKIQKVIETDKTEKELFVLSNQWMVKTFNNAESVIQFTDKESGTITGKYMLKQTYTIGNNYQTIPSGGIFAIINIDIKDNKARITVTPEEYRTPGPGGNPTFTYLEETAREDVNNLIEEFKIYINQNQDSDW